MPLCPLAWRIMPLYKSAMEQNSENRNSRAGGIFIVIGLLLGIAGGIMTGEISIGLVTGFALGVAAAIAVWLIDRRHDA